MMVYRAILFAIILLGVNTYCTAQELYVFTEPASNMPTNSIGIRLTNEGMFEKSGFKNRSIGEVMVGLNKNLMFHVQAFASDMSYRYKFEGASLYAKYRFLSFDNTQSHFRAAVYGRISGSNHNREIDDINLEGDNSGWQGGIILTQLIHKLALSGTFGYNEMFAQKGMMYHGMPPMGNMESGTHQVINYSLSSGYLLLPFEYKSYNQPNFNLYFEILGKTNAKNGRSYLDFAPALQLILNSKTRIDLGYRFQATGNMQNRYLKNMYLARVEFNFFNALSKKS